MTSNRFGNSYRTNQMRHMPAFWFIGTWGQPGHSKKPMPLLTAMGRQKATKGDGFPGSGLERALSTHGSTVPTSGTFHTYASTVEVPSSILLPPSLSCRTKRRRV
jgi:hypothetical protein